MIPSRQEIVYRIQGALRLARFDVSGLQHFDTSPEAALRSFFAAFLVAPAFAITLLLVAEEPPAIAPFAVLMTCILAYSLVWTVFPVIAHRICQVIGKEPAFFRFLSADNWVSVVGYHLQLVVVVLTAGELLPDMVSDLLQISLKVYVVALSWFVCRHGLEIGGLPAAGFVLLQFFVGLFIPLIAAGIIYGPAG